MDLGKSVNDSPSAKKVRFLGIRSTAWILGERVLSCSPLAHNLQHFSKLLVSRAELWKLYILVCEAAASALLAVPQLSIFHCMRWLYLVKAIMLTVCMMEALICAVSCTMHQHEGISSDSLLMRGKQWHHYYYYLWLILLHRCVRHFKKQIKMESLLTTMQSNKAQLASSQFLLQSVWRK